MNFWLYLSSLFLFALSMCFTPGPNNALAMATGMEKGFRAALPFCLGAGIGANVTLLLLGLGLNEAFERFPLLYEVLRYAGAVYLVWLAWKISGIRLPWEQQKVKTVFPAEEGQTQASEAEGAKERKPLGFWGAVLFQLLNVKVWLTNIMAISYYVGTGEGVWGRFAAALALFTIMGVSAMMSWAAGGMLMRRFLTSDGMRRANYAFALFLLASVALLFLTDLR